MEPKFSAAEPAREVFEAWQLVAKHIRANRVRQGNFAESVGMYDELYQPNQELIQRLQDYTEWEAKHTALKQDGYKFSSEYYKQAGELMEELAFLAFQCLWEVEDIQSYRSFDGQIDLMARLPSGSLTMAILGVDGFRFVVEAKNTDSAVDVKTFSRLGAIVAYKFKKQCHIGVFFTRSGATGFPDNGGAPQAALKDARATQIVFHASTDKYVVVLDSTDLTRLRGHGELIRVLLEKLWDVEDGIGPMPSQKSSLARANRRLPPHLARHQKKRTEP